MLDVSGHHLALLEWAAAVRQLVLLTLVANLFLPWGIAGTLAPAALGRRAAARGSASCCCSPSSSRSPSRSTAKMRLFRVPEFLGMAFLLALLALTSDSLLR